MHFDAWNGRIGGRSLIATMIAATAFLSGCDGDKKKNEYVPPPPPDVVVANPIEREVTSYLAYTGIVEASESVELRARVSGFLQSVKFQAGQRVKKGDVLFEIDPRQYQIAVDSAAADVKSEEAALVGAENDAKLARELADQRAGPEIDAIIKAARRDAIQAKLLAAKAVLEGAKLNLEYCTVVAPIDGRISKNMVDIGNLVGRSDPTLLATIVQASPAFVTVDVSESDVLDVARKAQAGRTRDPALEPGQIAPGKWRPCELGLRGDKEFPFKGRVDFVDPRMSEQTGTLSVRTRFDNPDEILVPGMFTSVRFAMETKDSTLVPEAALLSDQQGRFAMVVNDKDEVEVRRVEIGELEGSMRVVEGGLSTDDRVIVLGVLKARPGAKVTPKVQAPPPESKEKKAAKKPKLVVPDDAETEEAAAPGR